MGGRAKIAMIAVSCALLLGCFGGTDRSKANRPKTASAEGLVTFKGQPLDGALVLFHPSDPKGVAAFALTNANGKFSAKAFPPDPGAVPGTYKVTIEKSIEADAPPTGATPQDAHDAADLAAMRGTAVKSLIPNKYSKPESTPLQVEITADGKTDIKLELQ